MASLRAFSLKNISKITVSFCTFDANTASVREFLKRISSGPIRESNPNCQVETLVKNDGSHTSVNVKFSNGEVVQLSGAEHHVIDMMKTIKAKCDSIP